jgi:hypothetical protein
MKKNRITFIILGCTALLFFVMNFYARKSIKVKFVKFYNSTISGKLVAVIPGKGVTDIVIADQKFTFVPSFINNETDFPYFAKKGDSVYKPAKSDTLKLKHNGKIFLYTFQKF